MKFDACSTTSRSRRRSPFRLRPWWRTTANRRCAQPSGEDCVDELEQFAALVFASEATMPIGARETSWRRYFSTTLRALSIRICTRTASSSTRRTMATKAAGRRCRTTKCSARRSTPRTFTITNWPGRCATFGYTIHNATRGDFEIAEIAPELCERFSKRHREIDEKTREFLNSHQEKLGGNEEAIREHIAHKERARKNR